MVLKTTGSTSGKMSFKWFLKQCTVAWEIYRTNKKIKLLILWTLSICPFVKRIFVDFLRKIYERKMKNPLKSRHPFCWVHRVYGIQNDRLDLRIKDFFSVLKKMNYSRRYKQKGEIEKKLNREYLGLRCVFFKTEKKFLILRSSRSFWIP